VLVTVLSWVAPLIAAVIVSATSSTDNLFGGFGVSLAVMAIAIISGSWAVMAAAAAVFGLVMVAGDVGPGLMATAGVCLYASFVFLDLSISVRGGGRVERQVLLHGAARIAGVGALAVMLSMAAWLLGTARTWNLITLAIALVALGLAARAGAARLASSERSDPRTSP